MMSSKSPLAWVSLFAMTHIRNQRFRQNGSKFAILLEYESLGMSNFSVSFDTTVSTLFPPNQCTGLF